MNYSHTDNRHVMFSGFPYTGKMKSEGSLRSQVTKANLTRKIVNSLFPQNETIAQILPSDR